MTERKKPTAIYFRECKYQRENILYICEHFNCEVKYRPVGSFVGRAQADVIFWPRIYGKGVTLGKCRYVVTNTTGDGHIPISEPDTKIISLRGETYFLSHITPTAEHTMGLIHAVHRRITAANIHTAAGGWDRYRFSSPKMLSRSTLGIVGYGRLGKLVKQYSKSMFDNVFVHDPATFDCTLDTLLPQADVLTIHACGAYNVPIIGFSELIQLPKNAIVINTASGNMLDVQAACDLIDDGHLWGMGLDCLPTESEFKFPAITEQMKRLMEQGRLILTPHIGGSTEDAWYETERFVINKVLKELQNV